MLGLAPAVVIHGMSDTRAALAPARPVTLLSAPGAALYTGCAVWRALITAAREIAPAVPVSDILDCADASGQALAALRLGQRFLVLHEAAPGRDAVAAIAAASGAVVLAHRPPALDLARRGSLRRLPIWLGADDSARHPG